MSNADWVKFNHDELMQLAPPKNTLQDTMQQFLSRHDLGVLIVTCGNSVAMAPDNAGEFLEVTQAGNLPIVNTVVGADDASSAVLFLGMQQGSPLSVTLDRAQSIGSPLVTQT